MGAALAVGFGASTFGAFLISTTVGLYGLHEVWTGSYVFAAAVSAVVAIIAGALVLLRERHGRPAAGALPRRVAVPRENLR